MGEMQAMNKTEDMQMGESKEVIESKRQSKGSKRCKKSREIQKDEEQFPMSLENLYNVQATTLIVFTEMVTETTKDNNGEDGREANTEASDEEK